MRVTNTILSNRMMLNINRNMRAVDKIYQQLATGKKISVPSDDPILAARALKFRTNVAETLQYQKNVEQGMAWMEVSEGAYKNMNAVLKNIRDLVVRGSTGTFDFQDRQAISTEVQQLLSQLGNEINVTYGGRYVFSGYRTNMPPVCTEDMTLDRPITQLFNRIDIENTKSYQKSTLAGTPLGTEVSEVHDVNILKLAYNNADEDKDMTLLIAANPNANPPTAEYTVPITRVKYNSIPPDSNPYQPGDDEAFYIPETGELVLGKNVAMNFTDNSEVTYSKSKILKGELNPDVYFLYDPATKTNPMDSQSLEYEFCVNTRIAVNSIGKDAYTDKLYADLKSFVEVVQRTGTTELEMLRQKYRDEGLTGTELETAVDEQLKLEKQNIQAVLRDRFNDMLDLIDRHTSNIFKMQSDMGSRMNRLELIENRLDQDEASYTELMSKNEDVDLIYAITQRTNYESVYQASLKAGANIIQMTLANFI